MTTEYPYDPAFPFVIHVPGADPAGQARFLYEEDAEYWASDDNGNRYSEWEIINTTPKPKIPEDAKYITWYDSVEERQGFAYRYGHPGNKVWRFASNRQVEEAVLIATIEDAEVTVLIEKEN